MHAHRMNRLIQLVLVGITAGLLASCGGDFSARDKTADPGESGPQVLALVEGSETEVFSGDEVVDPEGDARIRVRHDSDGDRKFVTLLSGSADLVRQSGEEG